VAGRLLRRLAYGNVLRAVDNWLWELNAANPRQAQVCRHRHPHGLERIGLTEPHATPRHSPPTNKARQTWTNHIWIAGSPKD
jgi:hypothetical protein